MSVRRLFGIAAGLALLALPCPDHVAAQAQLRCGEIASNQTWASGSVTQICADGVRVRNSTLTIQPGAEVLMDDGASLVIEPGSTLAAVGTAASQLRFRANTRNEAPGYWGQIRFEPGAGPSELRHAIVQYGGKAGVPMIEVRGSTVVMNNLILRGAADVPLAVTANDIGPALEEAGNVTVGGACNNIRVDTNNVVRAIGVIGDAAVDVRDFHTWHNFCAPYRVTEEIAIGGELNPELRLDVGTQVVLSGEGGFKVGVDADNPGQLLTNGTPTEPIVLTSPNRRPGDWYGIDFTEHSGFSGLNNTRVEYGGKGGRPMVAVRSREVTAVSSSFYHAAGVPLVLVPEAVGPFLSSAFLQPEDDDPAFVGNGVQEVHVLASEQPAVTRSAEWGDAGVPLVIDGDLYVGGGSIPRLALRTGAHLVFAGDFKLVVGDRDHGPAELDAAGTPDRPVRLGGATERPGAWRGVEIGDPPTTARLDYVILEHGGSPMLQWGRGAGDVTRTTFRGASGYPVVVPLAVAHDVILDPVAIDAEPGDDLRNTFEGNGTDRVLVTTARSLSAAVASWRDPGAPVEVDGVAVVSSATTPVLALHGGLTALFRADGGIQLGDGAGGNGGLVVSDVAAEGAVVRLGPVDAAAGWRGIRVLKGSNVAVSAELEIRDDQVVRGVQIGGVADDAACIDVVDGAATVAGVAFGGAERGAAVRVSGVRGTAEVSHAVVSGFRVGLHTLGDGRLTVSRTHVQGNLVWGYLNENGGGPCQSAALVYWGAPGGPNDESDAEDGCVNATNVSPGADRVSDYVDWWPHAVDEAYTPASGLGPNPRRVYLPYLVRPGSR